MNSRPVDVLIVAALEEERDAVLKLLAGDCLPTRHEGSNFHRCTLYWKNGQGSYAIVLACLGDMGNVNAAAVTTEYCMRMSPSYVALVGIAGGVKEEPRQLGDLLIAEEIFPYERGKVTPEGFIYRGTSLRADAQLLEFARKLSSPRKKRDLSSHNSARRPTKTPPSHFGKIGSGEKVIADDAAIPCPPGRDPPIGVEMEAYGTALAAKKWGAGFFFVKGICDWADVTKNDDWHAYAAETAAVFLIDLLRSRPFPKREPPPAPLPAQGIQMGPVVGADLVNASWVAITGAVDDLTRKRLESIRENFQQGLVDTAWREVRELKEAPTFHGLSPETRAKVLGLEASLVLERREDVEEAQRLANQAEIWCPGSCRRLITILTLRAEGHEAALAQLPDPDNSDDIHLKASLLVETGRGQEALDLLDSSELHVWTQTEPQPKRNRVEAETLRLRAWALLDLGRPDEALESAHQALQKRPGDQAMRLTAAAMTYFNAIFPASLPQDHASWLIPLPIPMLPATHAALDALQRAEDEFVKLIASPELSKTQRVRIEGYRLASLGNHPARQDEAAAYCKELLDLDRTHPDAILWSLARRFRIDLRRTMDKLEDLTASGKASLQQHLSQWICLEVKGKPSLLSRAVAQAEKQFREQRQESLWRFWRTRSLIASGKTDEAQKEAAQLPPGAISRQAGIMIEQERATHTRDWRPLADHLLRLYDDCGDAEYLLHGCGLLAECGNWDAVATRADALSTLVANLESLRLIAFALWNTGRWQDCLDQLKHHSTLIQGNQPNVQNLRTLKTMCLRTLGHIPEAVREMESLFEQQPSETHGVNLVRLYRSYGNQDDVPHVIRRILPSGQLRTETRLELAHTVIASDPDLARYLIQELPNEALDDRSALAKLNLALRLGLKEDTEALMPRLPALAQIPGSGVQSMSVEDLLEFRKQQMASLENAVNVYRSGAAPIHLLCAVTSWPLALLYHLRLMGHWSDPRKNLDDPLFIRHGGWFDLAKPDAPPAPGSWFIDVTALLLADYLGLLDSLERQFAPIWVADALPQLLMEMVNNLKSFFPPISGFAFLTVNEQRNLTDRLDTLRRRLVLGIEMGTYCHVPLNQATRSDMEKQPDQLSEHSIGKVLASMFGSMPAAVRTIWCDDRFISGLGNINGLSILGIQDVLGFLEHAGLLSNADVLAAVRRLRAADLRHLVLEDREILAALRAAPVKAGRVEKSPDLVQLRRSLAAMLRQSEWLNHPGEINGQRVEGGEWIHLIHLMLVIVDSLGALWTSADEPEADLWARADWIWNNLFFLPDLGRENGSAMERLLLHKLVMASLTLPMADLGTERSPRKRYFTWLQSRSFWRHLMTKLEHVRDVTHTLKQFFMRHFRPDQDKNEALAVRILLADMPEPFYTAFTDDSNFVAWLRIARKQEILIGELSFSWDEFWQQAAQAVAGQMSEVHSLDSQRTFSLQWTPRDGKTDVCLTLADGHVRMSLGDIGHLLDEHPETRQAWLRNQAFLYDMVSDTTDDALDEIARQHDPTRRVHLWEKWKAKGAEGFYRQWHDEFQRTGSLTLAPDALLPPSGASLLWHARLESTNDASFPECLDRAARRLLRETGVKTTLERLAGLPVPMPASLVEAIDTLDPNERTPMLLSLLHNAASPVAMAQAVRLLLRNVPSAEVEADLAQSLSYWTSIGGTNQTQGFLSLLGWMHHALTVWSEARDWTPDLLMALAWMHSHRLMFELRMLNADPTAIHRAFQNPDHQLPVLHGIFEDDNDVSLPQRSTPEALLLHCLSHAMEGRADLLERFPALADAVRDLVFPPSKNDKSFNHALIIDTTCTDNTLGSFLQHSLDLTLFCGLAPPQLAPLLSEDYRADILDHYLKQLEENDLDPTRWNIVGYLVHHGVKLDTIAPRLNALLANTDFAAVCQANPEQGLLALKQGARIANALDDVMVLERIEAQMTPSLKAVLRGNCEEYPPPGFPFWLEAAMIIAKTKPTSDLRAQAFSAWLLQAEYLVPSLAPSPVGHLAQRLSEELPTELARHFWQVLFHSRSRPVIKEKLIGSGNGAG
ncbi:MAG: hypothetical protein G8345_00845 [Magnetococcales bacterium]|nr:hypothetical protein [Magnetococcales bacterium]NGZ25416.1 hypothetical protein [Magnetococcales bacterium]